MSDALTLTLAMLSSLTGVAWFALAMETHWNQVYPSRPLTAARVVVLRMLGGVALLVSLLLCLRTDHASMASLVWIMSLAPAAIAVAMALAWRPSLLSWVVP